MPFTLDDYYPRDSVEAQSWLYVQKYTHTHHVTWKHVAYAARYDALLSFFRSHSTLRAPRSPVAISTVSNEEDDGEHAARTRSDSAYSSSSVLSASSHASSSTSLSTPSPTSRISSLPIIDPQSIPTSSTSNNDNYSSSSTTSTNDCRDKLYTTPDSSNIIYIPPRTLADLADVLGRLAMSYMLTHISYLRESLKGSDFSTMKSIALGGLRELMLRESTRSSSFVGQVTITSSPSSTLSSLTTSSEIGSGSGSSLASSSSSENLRSAERRPSTTSTSANSTGSAGTDGGERRNVGQDWLRLFDGRDEWDGKTPTLDLRASPPALSRPQQLPRSNPYPRNEVHRGGVKV